MSCSTVSTVHWSKKLFSSRLQGSCAVKCQLKHVRLQWQLRYKGVEKTFHPTACKSCPFFVYCLQHSSYGYLKNSCKPPVPAANRLGRNFQPQPKWAPSIKHRKRNCHLSRVRTLPRVSSHQRALTAAFNSWPDITGLSDSPQTSTGTAKAGAGWAENCPTPETGSSSRPDFPLKTHVGFISGSIHCVHCFLLQAVTSHFYPSVVLVPELPFNVALKGCNWCIWGAEPFCTRTQLQNNNLEEFLLYVSIYTYTP